MTENETIPTSEPQQSTAVKWNEYIFLIYYGFAPSELLTTCVEHSNLLPVTQHCFLQQVMNDSYRVHKQYKLFDFLSILTIFVVFILDSGKHCFVWIGRGASHDEKKNGFSRAHVSGFVPILSI